MKKSAAIIGAGMCGLACAWHLSERFQVVVFDKQGVGGGASGMASGLMHPYPGEQARRSRDAEAGIAATEELLQVAEKALSRPVADRTGILRRATTEAQRKQLMAHAKEYADILPFEDGNFFIKAGVVVDMQSYLAGLWQACCERGAVLYPSSVESLEQLKDFDLIVIAAGAGITHFEQCSSFRLKKIKGQILKCKKKSSLPNQALIGKGYLTVADGHFHFGATYEREFLDDLPDLEQALKELQPKYEQLAQTTERLEPIEVKAGVRIAHLHDYYPVTVQIDQRTYAITAMGSRGLLYHALLAKRLCTLIFSNNAAMA